MLRKPVFLPPPRLTQLLPRLPSLSRSSRLCRPSLLPSPPLPVMGRFVSSRARDDRANYRETISEYAAHKRRAFEFHESRFILPPPETRAVLSPWKIACTTFRNTLLPLPRPCLVLVSTASSISLKSRQNFGSICPSAPLPFFPLLFFFFLSSPPRRISSRTNEGEEEEEEEDSRKKNREMCLIKKIEIVTVHGVNNSFIRVISIP